MNNFLKNSMNFGALCGVKIIIFSLLLYFLEVRSTWINLIVTFGILIFFIVWGTIYYRNNYANGIISYGRSLGSGVLISLFASVLVAFYIYTFFKILAPYEIDRIYEQYEENLYNQGMSNEQIEMTLQLMKKITTPLTIALGTIFSYLIWGTIFSLIIAAFVKKSGSSYQQIMAEVENELSHENNDTTNS